jgi:hypothetical protein
MLYVKTDAGRGEVQARNLHLTPAQRQVLILCDGERHVEDLMEMMPAETLEGAVRGLFEQQLLKVRDLTPRRVKEEPVELDEVQRYRAIVELATSMAMDLGFAARVRAQLQIERAQTVQDLTGVIELLCKHLKSTPLMQLRLQKLRQLAAH